MRRGAATTAVCALAVLTLAMPATAGPPAAAPIKIKGIRWVDGVKTKVRCKKGHTLALEPHRRTVTLAVDEPSCGIVADATSLLFEGTEAPVVDRGRARPQRTLVAPETGAATMTGTVSSILSLARDGAPKKDKGTIAYMINDGGPVVVFLGTYAARGF